MKPMSPQDVSGAGTEELGDRFAGSDAITRENLMKEMQIEDDAMEPLREKYRLDVWYESILDAAKCDFEHELAEETEDGQKMQQMAVRLDEVEREIKENEQRKAESLLHSKPRYKPKAKANGKLGDFRHSIRN